MSKASIAPLSAFLLCAFALHSLAAEAKGQAPPYRDARAEVLLDNERVLVEKFILNPGQSAARRSRAANALLVFIKGGILKSEASGRSVLWKDGRVLWQGAGQEADGGATNAGPMPIEMVVVTLKPSTSATPTGSRYLNYPNIPGEDLLENDYVIVQRFTVLPGQWEGVHAHHPNMLYIHIKGGQWAARSKKEAEHPYPAPSADGKVGWMAPIDISEGHESGNIGNEPIDLIWVTLKK